MYHTSKHRPLGTKGSLSGVRPLKPLNSKGVSNMNEITLFVLGAMIGGFIATMILCAIQINRNEEEENGEA